MTQPAAPSPKFRRRAEDRPDELLDAALTLFLDRGYAHTSVAQIARKAGLSKGAVYLYFPSKQAVLEGLVRRAVRPVATKVIAEADHGTDLRATLTAILKSVAQGLADPRTYAIPKIVMREAVVAPDIAEMYRRAVLDAVLPAAVTLLTAGIASGQIRAVDPELTLRSIVGPIVLHVLLAEVFGIRPEAGLALDRLVDNHLDILFNGLFPMEINDV